jgi:hypothetical protein
LQRGDHDDHEAGRTEYCARRAAGAHGAALMHGPKLHLHSMLVHSVLAFVPVAAMAFVLGAAGVALGPFDGVVWRFLIGASLVVVLFGGVLATVTGVLERRHLYVTWHRTHALKLGLALAMVALAVLGVGAFAGLVPGGPPSVLGALAGLVPVAAALAVLGLKMTLGRMSFAATSYVPDLEQRPPVDVLAATAARLAEPADIIDPMEEVVNS